MTTPTQASYAALDAWIDQHFDEEVRFLQALVRVPTDTPPGNNAPHAERTAELLKDFGFDAEKHAVPAAEVQAYGMVACSFIASCPAPLGMRKTGRPRASTARSQWRCRAGALGAAAARMDSSIV